MKREACLFWKLDESLFTLVLPNMHDIMSLLTKEENHMAYTIEKYFEIHRAKRAELLLIQPERMRQELEEVEKNFLLIKGAKQTDRFSNKDKRDFEERLEENKKKNLDLFFSKYPGLKEE